MTLLALKVLLAPSLVVASSLVARRFGSRMGGVVAGLPAISGPILFVLALDDGRTFAGAAARGALLGVVAVMAFVLAYAAVSSRLPWPIAVCAGWAFFLAAVVALRPVHVGSLAALCIACAATGATLVLLPRPRPIVPAPRSQPRWDLPLRAACTVIPVVAVTAAAGVLGAHLSGLLASFPVITPVLAAFTHAQRGAKEAGRLLHGITIGFYAYALFCCTLSVSLHTLGIAESFALATASALAVQGAAFALTRRQEQTLLAAAAR